MDCSCPKSAHCVTAIITVSQCEPWFCEVILNKLIARSQKLS